MDCVSGLCEKLVRSLRCRDDKFVGVGCGEWFELMVCGGRNKDSFVEKGVFLLIT